MDSLTITSILIIITVLALLYGFCFVKKFSDQWGSVQPFALDKLDADMFRLVLKKMNYQTGRRLYRCTKGIKQFCDEKRIRFNHLGTALVYEEQRVFPEHFTRTVRRLSTSYLEDLGFLGGRWFWHRAVNGHHNIDLFQCSAVLLLRCVSKEFLEEIRKDLRAMRSVREIVVHSSFVIEDLGALIATSAMTKLEIQEMFDRNRIDVRFCFMHFTALREDFSTIFERCGYRRTVEIRLWMERQLEIVQSIVREYCKGADVGNLTRIRLTICYECPITLTELFMYFIGTKELKLKPTGTHMRYNCSERFKDPSLNGKDLIRIDWPQASWPGEPFIDINFFD